MKLFAKLKSVIIFAWKAISINIGKLFEKLSNPSLKPNWHATIH